MCDAPQGEVEYEDISAYNSGQTIEIRRRDETPRTRPRADAVRGGAQYATRNIPGPGSGAYHPRIDRCHG